MPPNKFIVLAALLLLLAAPSVRSAPPQRILSLCSAATDALTRAGLGERLAGIDEYSVIVAPDPPPPVLARHGVISSEAVLAAQIDLGVVWWYQSEAADALTALGIPVVRLRAGRVSEVPELLATLGAAVGADLSALAEPVSTLAAQPRPAARYRVYCELYSPYATMGAGSYLDDLLTLAGLENIAAAGHGTVLLSPEQLIAGDPEIILLVEGFGDPVELAARPGLAGVQAVRRQRIYQIPRRWLVAGAGLPEAVEQLKELLK